jgi:hypothetical protein
LFNDVALWQDIACNGPCNLALGTPIPLAGTQQRTDIDLILGPPSPTLFGDGFESQVQTETMR